MVSYGKKICKSINPQCGLCPVEDRCLKLIQKPGTSKKRSKSRKKKSAIKKPVQKS